MARRYPAHTPPGVYPPWLPPAPTRARPNLYDNVILPRLATQGGKAFQARLSPAEKRAMVTRITVASLRSRARKRGHPEPHIVLAVMRPAADGSPVVDHYEPLPVELGGTGEWPKGLDPASLDTNPPSLVGLPKKRSPG